MSIDYQAALNECEDELELTEKLADMLQPDEWESLVRRLDPQEKMPSITYNIRLLTAQSYGWDAAKALEELIGKLTERRMQLQLLAREQARLDEAAQNREYERMA